jgi:hypothetical protein
MNEANLNAVCAALLFMAEKYRQIVSRADIFDDGELSDRATTTERDARRIASTIASDGLTNATDAEMATTALLAFADNMNTHMQILMGRHQVQDAALVEHRIREVYAAAQAVSVVARGLTLPESAANVPATAN